MNTTSKHVEDKRVLNIANEIVNARATQLPRILLQLQDVLDSHPSGSVHLSAVKSDIWNYDIVQVLLLSLKQDFAKLPQGWETASKLAHILSQCAVGIELTDRELFYSTFLPDAVDHLLCLARKLQIKYCKTLEVLEDTRKDLLDYLTIVLQSVQYLCGAHSFLPPHVIKSPWLLKMLMDDNVETCVLTMATIQSMNKMKKGLFGEVNDKLAHSILDELVYKLSASENVKLAGSSTHTILVICDSHPAVVQLLCMRYRGLSGMLNKWRNRGFGRDLRKLQLLLESGSMEQAKQERLHRAARAIQAVWRSHVTRSKLRRADKAIATFQRSFRQRKEQEEKHRQQEKEQQVLRMFVLHQRRRAMRSLRLKQFDILDLLPASEVGRHLAGEQTQAALHIQKIWRGYRVRHNLQEKRSTVKQMRAAITLQRAVRKWLERVRGLKEEPPNWQRPPGLTDQRRVDIQDSIVQRREIQPPTERSRTEQEAIHDRVQSMLKQHCALSKDRRQKELHRYALLAQLEMDASLMLTAPSLADAENVDLSNFVSHSVPIATKARHDHSEELRLLRQPWWKKLGDEYQDQKIEEEQAEWKVF